MPLSTEEQVRFNKLFKLKRQFICPLSNKLIRDAVFVDEDPLTIYDRESIEQWFTTHDLLPSTRMRSEKQLNVNLLFSKQLSDYKEKVSCKCVELATKLMSENRDIDKAVELLNWATEVITSDQRQTTNRYNTLLSVYENTINCLIILKMDKQQVDKRIELIRLLDEKKEPAIAVHMKAILLDSSLKIHLDRDQQLFLFTMLCQHKRIVLEQFNAKGINSIVSDFAQWSLGVGQEVFQLLPDIRDCLEINVVLTILEKFDYHWHQFRTLLNILIETKTTLNTNQNAKLDELMILKLKENVDPEDISLVTDIGIQYYEWRHNTTTMNPEFFDYGKKYLAVLADLDPENTKLKELQIDHCETDHKEMLKVLTVQMMKILVASNEMKKEIEVLKNANAEYELDKKHYLKEIADLSTNCTKFKEENKKLKDQLDQLEEEVHTSSVKKYKARIKKLIKRDEDYE
jgi:hypothetical protein